MPRGLKAFGTTFFLVGLACTVCARAAPETARDRAILEIQQLIVRGDMVGAHTLLAKSAREFPGDAGFDNLSGVLAAEEHHYTEAESSFRQAVKLDPKLTPAYLNLGRLYQENPATYSHAAERALSMYDSVLKYDPQNPEANYQSALLLMRSARYRDSLTRIRHLPARTQQSAQALSLLCADYAAMWSRTNADDAFARLVASLDFSEPDVRQMLAGLHAGKRDDLVVEALLALRKDEILPADLQHTLGLAYERSGNLAGARSTLEEFVTAGNLSVDNLMELARVAYRQGDFKGSLGYLAHARDLQPDNAAIHYSFGVICVSLELLAEARNSFEKAVKLEPNNASYNYAMGMISSFNREPEDATPYLEKYLKLRPHDSRAKLALGADFLRAKDYTAAAPWLDEAMKDPATATSAHYYLGSLELETNHPDEAAAQFRTALKTQPDYPDALAELGHYYLIQRRYSDAEMELQHALKLDPDHFSGNFYLLMLYARTGDPRREAQSNRYDDLQRRREEKSLEFLRMVTVRPFDTSQP